MKPLICFVAVFTSLLAAAPAKSAILFESGTLGPTGIPSSDLSSGAVAGTSVDFTVYAGVRFRLTQPAITEQVGGHFVSGLAGTLFAAIVQLDDENDFPDSLDFTSSDFLGATLLDFPSPISDETFGSLALSLDPGWYSLVFGSGLFGATGDGAAVRNGVDIGDPTYIVAQPFSGITEWIDFTSELPNHRFVIAGQFVPEPEAMLLVSLAICFFLNRRGPC